MTGPICQFVARYAAGGPARLHMPGHKGKGPLGCEALDITEIAGADDLSCPEGIIRDSEAAATAAFGSRRTFYSTGGSSQCLKAMVYLALLCRPAGAAPEILAGRNAHKSFLHACALLDVRPQWLMPERQGEPYCACPVTAAGLERALDGRERPPAAVLITSPDYLGGVADVAALAGVCRARGVTLLVDNAHGAYLRFLEPSRHPLDLGAGLCCDSAHKTLPVLTGGAYLHLGPGAPAGAEALARQALDLFGSSSPSYLVLQSLDACNAALAGSWPRRLRETQARVERLKARLASKGVPIRPGEPMKLVVDAAAGGVRGGELAQCLRRQGVEPEYADEDFLVLMFSPDSGTGDLERVERALEGFQPGPARPPLALPPPGETALSPRQALFSPRENVPLDRAAGRICAAAAVSCPPAVPIAVMGERLTPGALEAMARLGLREIAVVREPVAGGD